MHVDYQQVISGAHALAKCGASVSEQNMCTCAIIVYNSVKDLHVAGSSWSGSIYIFFFVASACEASAAKVSTNACCSV